MRLLDLYCGAGGASEGYVRAGWEVVGVDHKPQKNYPYEFVQADALAFAQMFHLETDFDAIHAAPLWYQFARSGRPTEHVDQLTPTYEALVETGLPFVLEIGSSKTSPFRDRAVSLCGYSFGLEIIRHMYFVCNWPIMVPPCHHPHGGTSTGELVAYGSHSASRLKYGKTLPPRRTLREWKQAAGLERMTHAEASLASPPAYTEYLGSELLRYLS